ncbi:hypothetical protein PR202_gb08639 [Eleusine coracana subsp. coracana]|uniref:Uncharacterized protein n=1 Tax=Eleusine coracana subsp. coracana TaxID=191504 RepID=A0AAV5EEN8_ELECO|nr:hypothetical protein PR202_gb08639 [Eleusine coracana subsp. coracana]
MEVFIHEEYVNKRREQRQQQRHRRQMKTLQIETAKRKPQQGAASGQGSPRDQPAGGGAWSSPVGSPTAEAASFRDHLFDYLKPY